ncbi:MAG TPA: transcription initiation factor IIB [Nitrososphaera sp.]|nr:transcription initiation factor IIB [Nitrososphaera sp.]
MTNKALRPRSAILANSVVITDPETGELIRKDTGEVISDNTLSREKEWRSFDTVDGENRARTGTPTSLAFHDMGLSTVIGKEATDASGNNIDMGTRMRMNRLRTWDYRSQVQSSTERSLQKAFSTLSRLKDRLGLPNHVTEKAAYTYRKAQERGLIRGDTIDSVLAASIYVALRQSEVPRTLDEISEISNVKLKYAARSYRRIITELDIKTPMIDLSKYIMKIANKLGFDEKIKRKALELMGQAQKKNILLGKDPMSMASSILYLVNVTEGHNKTQSEIAKAAGTTEVTVRNRSKELREKLGIGRSGQE